MLRFCVLSILLAGSAVCLQSSENQTAVSNGIFKRYSSIFQPWMVYLYISGHYGPFDNPKAPSGCYGILYKEHFIITAANCIRPVQGNRLTLCPSFNNRECDESVQVDQMPIIYSHDGDQNRDDESLAIIVFHCHLVPEESRLSSLYLAYYPLQSRTVYRIATTHMLISYQPSFAVNQTKCPGIETNRTFCLRTKNYQECMMPPGLPIARETPANQIVIVGILSKPCVFNHERHIGVNIAEVRNWINEVVSDSTYACPA